MIRRTAWIIALILLLILAGLVVARELPAEGWAAYPPPAPYPVATVTPWPTVTMTPAPVEFTATPLPPRPKATPAATMPPPDGLPYIPE